METSINTYRLNQGNQEYIFTTSIIGNKIKLACKNSSDKNNIKYTREFTIEQLKQIDEIFNIINSPSEASDYIDRALSKQKVRVSEESNHINICFYITTNGVTNQIDIPLYDTSFSESNVNSNNYNENNLLNSAFSQNNQNSQYYSQIGTNYEQGPNIYNYNQFMQTGNIENPPIITPVDDSTNQYFDYQNSNTMQYTQNYDTNQYLQNYQANQFVNQIQGNEEKPYISPIEDEENNAKINEQINQFLHQQNTNINIENMGTEDNKDIDLQSFSTTKVLPIQTTSRVLPVLGPFTSLEGIDFYQLANINAQRNSDIAFQPIQQNDVQTVNKNVQEENKNVQAENKNVQAENKNAQAENKNAQAENKNIKSKQIIKNEQTKTTIKTTVNMNKNNSKNVNSNINTNANANINKNNKNPVIKKQISDKKTKKVEQEEISMLKSQLAELEPLRKKVAEMEVLRSQLTELNSLRAQVAEYKAIKDQFKDIDTLRSQVDQLSLENEKLKIRVEELEDIKSKYEEEISSLKENEKMYSMQSRLSNNKDNKDIIYEENSQDMTVKGDIIHDPSELDLLIKKINKLNQKLTLNLLYKATADSDKAAVFHEKCDDAQSSIVLIETDKGKRFGGYTTCSWSGDCVDKRDEEAFVFSLDKMTTYDNIPGEDAIGCYPKFGPIFLGCQIRIYDNAFIKGGTTFERGLNFETEEDYELTGGDRIFNVKDIEVYEVIKE